MFVTRFAPSPTGYLHLGHAYAAIRAKDAGERFYLRIEDIDRERCRPEFEAAIYEDLRWLGLQWDEPVLRQSRRAFAYRAALQRLQERALVYPCFCTRKEIAEEIARAGVAPHGSEGSVYPGLCRRLSEDERRRRIASGASYALRLDAAKAQAAVGSLTFDERGAGPKGQSGLLAVDPPALGDVVLARKDMPAAYHLAATVDDAFQGVTLVTRGEDLFAATHVQRTLQAALDLPAPAYAHHRLILDANGKKFSKRDSSVTLRALRDSGATPQDIRAQLGR
ncbi:MAG TPA: tRNA glutamyl-Q(34) synthetase GluQRS [Rhizomicrobium sp.]|nr:tRNA glutamyl-Q(34) synthetase GluQRS [Rhizomicrobium sp.]